MAQKFRRIAGALVTLAGVAGLAYVVYRAVAVPPPPPKQPPAGQLGVKLELVSSPSSPALVRCIITVMATKGTTPIDFSGSFTSEYGGSAPLSATITKLNVPVTVLDTSWDVPAGETEKVTAEGELTNPFNSYTLPEVSDSISVPGEPPEGLLAVKLASA